jgi:alkylation response protein AidB-like acyl-CoA dehydrogenase
MREAVSLMGGYGITEDCPGFLGYKWMDAQLEATYEGPEAVQRRQLTVTMTHEVFLAQFRRWIGDMRKIASLRPGTGACTVASAMELWLWTLEHLQRVKLFQGSRQAVTFPMADALCWLVASRAQILDVEELRKRGPENLAAAEGLEGTLQFLTDLCHVQAARAAGEVSRICSELVFGHRPHPSWEGSGNCCFQEEELISLESVVPGAASFTSDYIHEDGHAPVKAGPCVNMSGLGDFNRLHTRLNGCLSGFMFAKERAAQSLQRVMIPAALDYPA